MSRRLALVLDAVDLRKVDVQQHSHEKGSKADLVRSMIQIDEKTYRNVRSIAGSRGVSASELINGALEAYEQMLLQDKPEGSIPEWPELA